MSAQKSTLWLLTAFTLAAALVSLVGELFKTHLIWYFRFMDFVDLVVVAPLYLASLLLLYEQFLKANASRRLRRIFLILVCVFLYGHAMHMTANAVNTFSTEIRNYRPIIPDDSYALLHFLDETLSHLIIFAALDGLLACLLVLDAQYLASEGSRRPQALGLVFGGLFGVCEALAFIEGGKVYLVPFVVVVLGAIWLWLWRRSRSPFAAFLSAGPVTAFVGALLPSLLVALGVYAAVVGGFTQPSELGL